MSESWWDKLSEKEQQEYLAEHPDSEKNKTAMQDVLSAMSDETKKEHEVAINNIIKDPSSIIDEEDVRFDTDNFKQTDIDKINKHLTEAKTTKSKKAALKLIAAAALITLTAAGALVLGLPIPDPVFAISSVMLMRDILPTLLEYARNAAGAAISIAEFTSGLVDGIKQELKNPTKVKKSLVPV
jgi:hypothetical protein